MNTDTTEVEDKGDYTIEHYGDARFSAVGKGLAGKILFQNGRVAECAFYEQAGRDEQHHRKTHPDDKIGLIREFRIEYSDETKCNIRVLRYSDGSYRKCSEKRCCLGVTKSAVAYPPYSSYLSGISKGSANTGAFAPRDARGNISLPALYLTLIRFGERYNRIEYDLIDAINKHPDQHEKLIDDWSSPYPIYGSAYDQFERAAGRWLLDEISHKGSKALSDASKLLAKIEKNWRFLEKSETDLIDAISATATTTFEVPTKKSVFDVWVQGSGQRNERVFRDTIKRLGFDWLPKATRGKKAH